MNLRIEKIKKHKLGSIALYPDEVGYLLVGNKNGKAMIERFKRHGKESQSYYKSTFEFGEKGAEPRIIFSEGDYSKLSKFKKEYNKKPIEEAIKGLERDLLSY